MIRPGLKVALTVEPTSIQLIPERYILEHKGFGKLKRLEHISNARRTTALSTSFKI
jgi:hypothetical protein